jgi:hypothetical protein
MHGISDPNDQDKLRLRRQQIKLTVEFLRAECAALQGSAQSMDPEAYQRRMRLFECLIGYYEREAAQIEKALGAAESSGLQAHETSTDQPRVG